MPTYLPIMQQPIILTSAPGRAEDDCACPDGNMAIIFINQTTSADENDCACPGLSEAPVITSSASRLFIQTPGVQTTLLPNRFRMAFSPYAPGGPSALNQAAWERWTTFRTVQPLAQEVDQILLEQNLICPKNTEPVIKRTLPTDSLTAWLHITNACNLDCPYCYVQKSPTSMSKTVGRQAIEKIFETAQKRGFRRVKIKYAGGEATLHFESVRELSHHARTLSRQKDISLHQVILSNGTHVNDVEADWLQENDVKLMISLDGVGEDHNRIRRQKNGRGSFELIEYAVDHILLPRGIHPFISIMIFKDNATRAAQAVRWALEHDLPVSLNFYRQKSPLRDTLAAEEQAILHGMQAAYAVFDELLPTRPFINGLLDRVQVEAHVHTCGVGRAYLAITHEGKLAQCQMSLEHRVDDKLEEDLLIHMPDGFIQNLSVEEKLDCRDCPYRYRCSGGCPLETFRISGRWDAPSPNCHIYQELFPEVLRLEGLRLMKANGYL